MCLCYVMQIAAIIQPWGPHFGKPADFFGLLLRKYRTRNQDTKPILHPLGEFYISTNSLIATEL